MLRFTVRCAAKTTRCNKLTVSSAADITITGISQPTFRVTRDSETYHKINANCICLSYMCVLSRIPFVDFFHYQRHVTQEKTTCNFTVIRNTYDVALLVYALSQ